MVPFLAALPVAPEPKKAPFRPQELRLEGLRANLVLRAAASKGLDIAHKQISEVTGRPFPKMDRSAGIEKAFKALSLGSSAIIVRDGDKPIGLLAKSDFIAYLSQTEAVAETPEP